MKLSEVIREKGFGFVSDSDMAQSLLFVWKEYPMPYLDFLELPLPTYFQMVQELNKRAEEEKRQMEKSKRGRR